MNITHIIITLLLTPHSIFGQRQAELNHQKTDSIVSFFLGKEFFDKNTRRSYIPAESVLLSQNDKKRTGVVNYTVVHPNFSGRKFVISFSVNPNGDLILDPQPYGLVQIDGTNDSTWVNAARALAICNAQSYGLKKRSLRLTWDPTNQSFDKYNNTRDIGDIVPGELVWEIKGKVKFRDKIYYGQFQVNAFTGMVTRRFAIPWD